jgi:hypothetical protein
MLINRGIRIYAGTPAAVRIIMFRRLRVAFALPSFSSRDLGTVCKRSLAFATLLGFSSLHGISLCIIFERRFLRF